MPILPIEELKQAVVGGKIGAISIDTSVFEQNQFGFETGVLAQMSQFDGSTIQHLVIDTVLHEVNTHLNTQSELVKAQVKNALKPVSNSWGADKKTREEAIKVLFGEQSGTERTKDRLDQFLRNSSAVVLRSSDFVKLSAVLARYFDTKAPFGVKDAKKREFPDAVALLALEGWAGQQKEGVLVVSRDGDWKRFCEGSESVYFIDNLPQALSTFHVESNDAAQLFRTAVEQSQISDLDAQILEELYSQADKIEVDFEGHANLHYDEELTQIEVAAIEQPFSKQLSKFEVLDYSGNELQLQTTLRASVTAQFVVSFQHWDGIDKEYLGMGSTTVEMTEECDLDVILTVSFANGEVTLEQVELLPLHTSFDFGEVEPDWMDGDVE
jgi:hypothetical protein